MRTLYGKIPIILFVLIAMKLRRVLIIPILPSARAMWSVANKLVEGFLTVKEPFAEELTYWSLGRLKSHESH